MPRSSHANSRTYGSKLLGPKTNEATTEFPVMTRMCDIDHLNRTGEVRYIDEEEKGMPTIDQKANTKKLRADITTIEQFDAIGNYTAVAKKYHVATMTAHGLMKSLRSKKEKEEKQMINNAAGKSDTKVEETADILPGEEIATSDDSKDIVAVDCPKEDKEEVESPIVTDYRESFSEDLRIPVDEPNGEELYGCVDCGKGITISSEGIAAYAQSSLCQSCSEALAAEEQGVNQNPVEGQLSDVEFDWVMSKVKVQEVNPEETPEEIDKIMDKLDGNLTMQIGHMWKVVEGDLEIIRKLYVERAEREYDEQLSRVMTGKNA